MKEREMMDRGKIRDGIIEEFPTKVVFSVCVSNERGVFEGWE